MMKWFKDSITKNNEWIHRKLERYHYFTNKTAALSPKNDRQIIYGSTHNAWYFLLISAGMHNDGGSCSASPSKLPQLGGLESYCNSGARFSKSLGNIFNHTDMSFNHESSGISSSKVLFLGTSCDGGSYGCGTKRFLGKSEIEFRELYEHIEDKYLPCLRLGPGSSQSIPLDTHLGHGRPSTSQDLIPNTPYNTQKHTLVTSDVTFPAC